MYRRRHCLVGVVAISYLCSAHGGVAAVSERDWKVPGDGLLTYDELNQREWLDLSESAIPKEPISTLATRLLEVVAAETQPGGSFEGFKWANEPDVISLASSAGIDVSTRDFATNTPPTLLLIDLLGRTPSFSDGVIVSDGFFADASGAPALGKFSVDQNDFGTPSAGYISALGLDFVGPVGLMLYRQVPEASTSTLMLGYLVALRLGGRPRRC